MHRLVIAAVLLLAPLAHAQSLGELSAAMGVHDAAAGTSIGSASTARRVRESISGRVSPTGDGWQAGSRGGSHGNAGGSWATSSKSSLRGVRTSSGWATASAGGRGSSGGGWARKGSPGQR